MAFYSFNEVVTRYNNTTPVVSKYHTAEDNIRPIGQRRRKEERIVKLSRNKYALCVGYSDYTWYWEWDKVNHIPTPITDKRSIEATCAILWERRKDGDYIRIRNTVDWGHPSISHLNFLYAYLPYSIGLHSGQGGQYCGRRHYLPKTKYVPDHVIQAYSWFSYAVEQGNLSKKRDKRELWFKHEVRDNWSHYTLASKEFEVPRRLVDKQKKAKYAKHIQEFREWYVSILPFVNKKRRHRIDTPFIDMLTNFTSLSDETKVEMAEFFAYHSHINSYADPTVEYMYKRFSPTLNHLCGFTYMTGDK